MARILMFIVAAAVILAVLWFLVSGFLHLLVLVFWLVLLVALGLGLLRLSGRRSRAKE